MRVVQAPNITSVTLLNPDHPDVPFLTLQGFATVAWSYSPSEVPVVRQQVGVSVVAPDGSSYNHPLRDVVPSENNTFTLYDTGISQGNVISLRFVSENAVGLSSTARSEPLAVGTCCTPGSRFTHKQALAVSRAQLVNDRRTTLERWWCARSFLPPPAHLARLHVPVVRHGYRPSCRRRHRGVASAALIVHRKHKRRGCVLARPHRRAQRPAVTDDDCVWRVG